MQMYSDCSRREGQSVKICDVSLLFGLLFFFLSLTLLLIGASSSEPYYLAEVANASIPSLTTI
jgi:hypothetical protein